MSRLEYKTGVISGVEVYKEAWELIKGQFWMVFAVTLVGMLIGGVVPIVLIGPMMCGIYMVLFSVFEGRQVDFGQLFKGFDFFMPSLILSAIIMIPVLLLIFLIYVPMVIVMMAGPRMDQSEQMAMIGGLLVVELIGVLIMVCIHTLLIFAFPLIVDKKLGAIDAIKTSAKAVWDNLSGVVGLMCVGFGVAMVGYLMLCIGIYFALPLMVAATAVAYKKVFPSTSTAY